MQKANADLRQWLNTVANRRKHGTHRQFVDKLWQQEKPSPGPLPAGDYDTSLKVFRKVCRDCQVSCDTNRYVLPHHAAGKRIMLKVKDGTIRFFCDDQLLTSYKQSEGRHQQIANPLFYEQLKGDYEQRKKKYGRRKGAAARGLANSSLFPQVMRRPLSDYDRLAE